MKFLRALLPALALVAPSLACGRSANGLPAGNTTRTLIHDGIERSYRLHVPASYDSSQPAAVVLIFHGGGGNAQNAVRMTGFDGQSDQSGFLAVYPNGTGRLDDAVLTWNGGECCGYAQENDVDDVGFVRALLADLETIVRVDPKRVYATGMSNGAIFSYRLACEMSEVFAAIGPVAGTLNVDCDPVQPVSVIHIHGTADRNLPYEGGVGPNSTTRVKYTSVKESLKFWTDYNACQPNPAEDLPEIFSGATFLRLIYSGCARGTEVEHYKIIDGLHAWPGSDGPGWPGGDRPSSAIDATQVIWEFFKAHPKQ